MAILVDPRSGQKYEFPDENEGAARERFGFVTPEEHAASQHAEELQAEHGGEKLQTAAESAAREGAGFIGGFAASPGMPGAQFTPPVSATDVQNAIAPVTPEQAARAEANPISAGLGKAAADLPAYAAAGALTGGLGTLVSEAAGAAPAVGALAGATTSNAALATTQEAQAAGEEHRPIDVENIGKNFAFGAVLEGAGYGVAKGISAVLGGAERPVQAAVRSTIDRAGVAAEDLSDPAVLASARAETQVRIEETATKLANTAEAVQPPVASNVVAQRQAMRQAAEALPDLADDIEAAVKRPRQQRYQALLDLHESADSPKAQEVLDKLVSDRALWGDAAVDHGNTIQAIAAARASGPEALAEAARGIKDPSVQELVATLDSHFEDLHKYDAQELFGPPPSSGVRGADRLESAGAAARNYDDLDAAKAIKEVAKGKVNAGKIAEAAPFIREQLANESAVSADAINSFIYDDAGLGVKREDFAKGVAEWTPELVAKQDAWVDQVSNQALETANRVASMDHAGGLGKAANTEILKGLQRIQDAAGGAERNVAIDNMKRGVDGLIGRLGRMGNSVVDEETRRALQVELRTAVADPIREGLENPELFGRNAALQKAHNEPIHALIEPLNRVQKRLYEVTGKTWGEVGVSAIERRADPDAFRRIFEDTHGGGKLFQRDLAEALDRAEDLARNRAEHGLSHLEGIDAVIDHLQQIRDDMNMAEVLQTAEAKAGPAGGHNAPASAGGAIGANVLVHAAEFGGRAVGFPLGNIVRSSGAYGKVARGIDRLAEGLGFNTEMAKAGTATRSLLDRYASRVKGSSLLSEPKHQALMPDSLREFLEGAHAPKLPPVPPIPPPSGGGQAVSPGMAKAKPQNDVERAAAASDRVAAIRQRRSQEGAVIIQGEATQKIDKLANKLRESVKKYRDLEPRTGVSNYDGRIADAQGAVDSALHDLRDEYESRMGYMLAGREPAELGTRMRAKYDALAAGKQALDEVLGANGGAVEQVNVPGGTPAELYSIQKPVESAESWLKGRRTVNTEAGHVTAESLASSPLGLTTVAGAAGLGAYKAYQLATENPDDGHAQYLRDAGARDTTATARALTDPAAAADFARRSSGQPSTIELFQGEHETIQQAFMDRRAKVEQMMRNPQGVVDSLAEAFGGLSPALRDQLAAKAMVLATYLHSQLPPQRGVSVTRPNGLPPHPLEARSYALKEMTAYAPTTAFDDAKRGQLRHEQVDTLKATWPELYQDLSQQTLTEMGNGKSTIVQRQRADLLFGFQSAMDPAFSSRLSAAAAAARQAKQEATSGGAGSAPQKSKVTPALQPGGIAALSA